MGAVDVFHHVESVVVEIHIVLLVFRRPDLAGDDQLAGRVVGNVNIAFDVQDDIVRAGIVDRHPALTLKISGLFRNIVIDFFRFGAPGKGHRQQQNSE